MYVEGNETSGYTEKDFEDYRKKFKESGCKITINNVAHDVNIEDSSPEIHLSYQPLQTIPRSNMTDEAIARLAEKSIKFINDAKTDPNVALKLMGITDAEKVTNPLHAAILQYPYLLNDAYVKKVMQNALKAERTKAMGGKIILNGTEHTSVDRKIDSTTKDAPKIKIECGMGRVELLFQQS